MLKKEKASSAKEALTLAVSIASLAKVLVEIVKLLAK